MLILKKHKHDRRSMDSRRALITGITGQDGYYLSELLSSHGCDVVGVSKGEEGGENPTIEYRSGSITDESFVTSLVKEKFDDIYNLASVSSVDTPWENTAEVTRVTALAPIIFLEAIETYSPHTKFFQASSAEMYGDPETSPQTENTPFHPKTPYAFAKLFAHSMVEEYRKKGVFAVSGILFNHESPRRSERFVTRKITSFIAKKKHGSKDILRLGNLDASRDWSFAGDIVRGMWKSLQNETPDTYVFSSGEAHTVRDVIEVAAKKAGVSILWKGNGTDEVGVTEGGDILVTIDPSLYRPLEVHARRGDFSKARKVLGWSPSVSFRDLIGMMVEEDLRKGA
jgi:GDPmannose 4,6-dehydratase